MRVFLLFLLLSLPLSVTAQTVTIRIPQHANSLEEAFNQIMESDPEQEYRIVFANKENIRAYSSSLGIRTPTAPIEPLQLTNRNVTILGPYSSSNRFEAISYLNRNKEPLKPFMVYTNCTISFERFEFNSPSQIIDNEFQHQPIIINGGSCRFYGCTVFAPIETSGSIEMLYCTFDPITYQSDYTDNPMLYNTYSEDTLRPGLQVSGSDILLSFTETSVEANNGFRAVVIEDAENVRIENTSVIGGNYLIEASFDTMIRPVAPAIEITNSKNIMLSTVHAAGSTGRDVTIISHPYPESYNSPSYTPAENGGDGIWIQNSENVIIEWCQFFGGDGGYGNFKKYNLPTASDDFSGANGGHGIQVINSSIRVSGTESTGGRGGATIFREGSFIPGGEPGLPLRMDEDSVLLNDTDIHDWAIHE